MAYYVVVNPNGANVRSQMNTMNPNNLLRQMSANEGFEVYEIYNMHGISGLQVWGRVSKNPGGISQEYVCLQIGNRVFAKEQEFDRPYPPQPDQDAWRIAIDSWARSKGFNGPKP